MMKPETLAFKPQAMLYYTLTNTTSTNSKTNTNTNTNTINTNTNTNTDTKTITNTIPQLSYQVHPYGLDGTWGQGLGHRPIVPGARLGQDQQQQQQQQQ